MTHSNRATERAGVANAFADSAEWETRVNLAAAYRLAHHFGWTDLIYNHITAKVPGSDGHFLINPMGLNYDEVTASNLVKIDLDGNILSDTPYRINRAGFVIHSAIHRARSDAGCVFHTHSRAGVAVASLKDGLLALNQAGMQFYNRVSYHTYEGFNVLLDEQQRLVESLGKNYTLILRNHGLITVGHSIAKAFQRMYYLEQACQLMIDTLATGRTPNEPSPEVAEVTAARWYDGSSDATANDDIEWAAACRMMDRYQPGYRS
ncbi:class II aldolase/adducin family protein [Burkholderia sp. MR1-5-21]